MHNDDSRVHVSRHPLAADAIARLRDPETGPEPFRRHLRTLSRLLAIEATSTLPTVTDTIQSPIGENAEVTVVSVPTVVVPILRAGVGMLDGFLDILPAAGVGFIGLVRNESTFRAEEYYRKLPACDGAAVFLLDPMLATGGSAAAALEAVDTRRAHSVTVAAAIAAPEGVALLRDRFPGVVIRTGALDRRLNDAGFIVPGLGDAGDRLWGTQ